MDRPTIKGHHVGVHRGEDDVSHTVAGEVHQGGRVEDALDGVPVDHFEAVLVLPVQVEQGDGVERPIV